MIRDYEYFRKWEESYIAQQKPDYKKGFRIYESMLSECKKLNALSSTDYLQDIQADIRIAKILNSCSKNY